MMMNTILTWLFLLTLPFGFVGLIIFVRLSWFMFSYQFILSNLPSTIRANRQIAFMLLSFAAVLATGGFLGLAQARQVEGLTSLLIASFLVCVTAWGLGRHAGRPLKKKRR
jgi:hypothetical protein